MPSTYVYRWALEGYIFIPLASYLILNDSFEKSAVILPPPAVSCNHHTNNGSRTSLPIPPQVHTNAFFVSYLVTYLVQYFLLPLVLGHGALSCLLSNTLYAIAAVWYSYITYLGYTTLPFLGNTQVLLWYPGCGVLLLWTLAALMTMFGAHVNVSRAVMEFHYSFE